MDFKFDYDFNFNLDSLLYKLKLKLTQRPVIRLAVVGGPASGKTYLLSDFIQALGSLNVLCYCSENPDFPGNSFVQFRPNTTNNGAAMVTEVYAGRRGYHYGATCKESSTGKKLDIEFVNIPGESFEHTAQYNDIKGALEKHKPKSFRVVTYKNKNTGEERLIVELADRDLPTDEDIEDAYLPEDRYLEYLNRTAIYKELKALNYTRMKSTKINGKTLLKNMDLYDTDSVLESIGEIIGQLSVQGVPSYDAFEEQRYHFYFLHFCETATDIIVCDKIFTPKNTIDAVFSTGDLMNLIVNFYNSNNTEGPAAYLAYRGTDFMLQGKEEAYKALVRKLQQQGKTPEMIKNAVYSLFEYLVWREINPAQDMDPKLFERTLGLQLEDISEDGQLHPEDYVNFTPENGRARTGNGDARQHINAQIGTRGQAFNGLLNYAYPNMKTKLPPYLSNIPAHAYFTATPITQNFEIFVNDAKNPARFSNSKGHYFDEQFSSFNFGITQLCVDLLKQHGITINSAMRGDLLNLKRRK